MSPLLRKFTNKAVKEFEQANVDFGYIDGCHEYKCVARDLKDYSAKINRQLKSDCTCGFDGIFFSVFQAPMSNIQKNNVKTDVFNLTNQNTD